MPGYWEETDVECPECEGDVYLQQYSGTGEVECLECGHTVEEEV